MDHSIFDPGQKVFLPGSKSLLTQVESLFYPGQKQYTSMHWYKSCIALQRMRQWFIRNVALFLEEYRGIINAKNEQIEELKKALEEYRARSK